MVSVSDPATPISVLQRQLRLEARAGIGLPVVPHTKAAKVAEGTTRPVVQLRALCARGVKAISAGLPLAGRPFLITRP